MPVHKFGRGEDLPISKASHKAASKECMKKNMLISTLPAHDMITALSWIEYFTCLISI